MATSGVKFWSVFLLGATVGASGLMAGPAEFGADFGRLLVAGTDQQARRSQPVPASERRVSRAHEARSGKELEVQVPEAGQGAPAALPYRSADASPVAIPVGRLAATPVKLTGRLIARATNAGFQSIVFVFIPNSGQRSVAGNAGSSRLFLSQDRPLGFTRSTPLNSLMPSSPDSRVVPQLSHLRTHARVPVSAYMSSGSAFVVRPTVSGVVGASSSWYPISAGQGVRCSRVSGLSVGKDQVRPEPDTNRILKVRTDCPSQRNASVASESAWTQARRVKTGEIPGGEFDRLLPVPCLRLRNPAEQGALFVRMDKDKGRVCAC